MATRSIFALEMCLSFSPKLHQLLHALLNESTQRPLSLQDKWSLYDRASRCLYSHHQAWHSGCWDFYDDDMRARTDFNMWVNGMLTEEGARPTPSPPADPYRGDARFLTFTMAVLMVNGTSSERQLASSLNIPESRLWTRDTFAHVLGATRLFNFASIEASTMYLIPNEPGFALMAEDLRHPKFKYLRQIV